MNQAGRFRYWLPVVLWAGLIFVLSSLPGEKLVGWMILESPYRDKILHLIEYAVFGYLLARAVGRGGKKFSPVRLCMLVVGIALACGVLDEFHQSFVPNRDASFFDVIFDGLGAFLGNFLFLRKVRTRT